ncbi:MAG: DUF4367 domain-containing protein [Clostridia bacterium]|nr:DUF4367 domain-containing protein [Clostridia bacterium]MBQ2110262.1 DUF4367 domain-containing protein [Clostridia bacterium]MBQ3938416.1 DUF4367 domain-containing protein [Clostridia bacterium]
MTKNGSILADALGEVLDAEIDGYIAEAEAQPHEFSRGFERKMKQLLDSGRSVRPVRRILIIAAAFVMLLALVGFTSKKVRSSIAGFLIETFGDHDEYSDPKAMKSSIEEEYGLVPVPEGFEESNAIRDEFIISITYTNDENSAIQLLQRAGSNVSESVDNEHGVLEECEMDGKTVQIYLTEIAAHAAWIENGYYFSLAYTSASPFDLDQIIGYISSVTVK